MMFIDRLFLARYSAVAIQAALPAGLSAFTAIAFLHSVVGYSGTFVAQHAGAGARAACARAMGQGLWLALLCVPLLLLTVPLGNALFAWTGHAPEVQAAERVYYLTLVLGNLTVPFGAAVTGFFSGLGRTRLVMAATLAGNLANVALDPFLIWGWCGLPELGIMGAGLATALSQGVALAILLAALCRERHLAMGRRRQVAFAWQGETLWRIVRFGLPSGGHVLLDISTFTVFVLLTGRMDALSFAASNVGFAINNLIFAPLMGIGMASGILAGRRMGEGRPDAAVRETWRCLGLGWAYIGLCWLAIGLGSRGVLALFYPPDAPFGLAEFLSLGRKLILIFLLWAWFDTMNLVLGGSLKGAGDTRFVMVWVAGTSLLGWLPLLFLCHALGCGIVALWLTMLAYVVAAALGLLARFLRGRWKALRLLEA